MPHFGRSDKGDFVVGLTMDDLQGLVNDGGQPFFVPALGVTFHIIFRPTQQELRECFVNPDGTPTPIYENPKTPVQ